MHIFQRDIEKEELVRWKLYTSHVFFSVFWKYHLFDVKKNQQKKPFLMWYVMQLQTSIDPDILGNLNADFCLPPFISGFSFLVITSQQLQITFL